MLLAWTVRGSSTTGLAPPGLQAEGSALLAPLGQQIRAEMIQMCQVKLGIHCQWFRWAGTDLDSSLQWKELPSITRSSTGAFLVEHNRSSTNSGRAVSLGMAAGMGHSSLEQDSGSAVSLGVAAGMGSLLLGAGGLHR